MRRTIIRDEHGQVIAAGCSRQPPTEADIAAVRQFATWLRNQPIDPETVARQEASRARIHERLARLGLLRCKVCGQLGGSCVDLVAAPGRGLDHLAGQGVAHRSTCLSYATSAATAHRVPWHQLGERVQGQLCDEAGEILTAALATSQAAERLAVAEVRTCNGTVAAGGWMTHTGRCPIHGAAAEYERSSST